MSDGPHPPAIAAVLLAAGASRRLGATKQLLRDADDVPLVARLARTAREAGCAPVFVVTGCAAEAVESAVRDVLADDDDVTFVRNAAWAEGMATSIRAGVEAARDLVPAVDAVLLIASDQPAVSVEHLVALREAHARQHGRVVSAYDGVHGIPAVWPRADFAALCALHGDRGARALLRGDEDAVPLADGALDLDTLEDVYRWRASASDGA